MSDFLTLKIALFAGEALAASALIVALAWLASFRRSASARHLVWTAAFGALVLLPLLTVLVPGSIVWTVPSSDMMAPVATAPVMTAVPLDMSATAAPAVQAAPDAFAFDASGVVFWLFGIWAAGVFLFALRGAIAAFVLSAMRRNSVDNPFDPVELPVLASGRAYDLRVSNAEHGPITWGLFRPIILLPHKALFWPCERLDAVLRHELAHVARRDSVTQVLALAACALYWPNPLVWLGARAMRREAEMAADDAVIVSGVTPSDYAGELLEVAAEFRTRGLSPVLSMAAPSALEERLKSVLAPTQQRTGVTSMDVLKISAAALLATTALVLARPSLAQDAPSSPPATATMATPPVPPADAQAPTPPTPPSDAVDANTPVHHFHTREVRRYTTRDGRHHVQIVERDGDSDEALAQIGPDIDNAMAQVKMDQAEMRALHDAHIEAQLKAIGPQVQQALAEARAELSKITDEKIRARVDAALARAQEKMATAEAHMQMHIKVLRDGHHMDIRSNDDQSVEDGQDQDRDKDQDAPAPK